MGRALKLTDVGMIMFDSYKEVKVEVEIISSHGRCVILRPLFLRNCDHVFQFTKSENVVPRKTCRQI